MNPPQKGQALVMALITVPILLLAFAILAKSGGTLLIDDQIRNHCGKKILDALAIKGKGLQALGYLNPLARATISARRTIDKFIEAGAIAPAGEPPLFAIREHLVLTQKMIQRAQDKTTHLTLTLLKKELFKPPPKEFSGKISEKYRALTDRFSILKEAGYENEIGAPLEPTPNFEREEETRGQIKIATEKFLWRWQAPLSLGGNHALLAKNMKSECSAKIEMAQLEAPWTAHLVAPKGK